MDNSREKKHSTLYIVAGLAVLVLLAYYPVLNADFLNFDDTSYVTANSHVKSAITLDSLRWAFTTFHFYNWHPLTWVSHMMDVEFFGIDPMGHHAASLVLHILNTVLLFLLFRTMTGAVWRSAFVAALFAVHPLHVESVAWVSERKDVLSTFFWFLTMLAYVHYTRKPRASTYVLCALLFTLGLMSKPMLVTLPLVLLLVDYWPLRRFNGDDAGDPRGSFTREPLLRLILEKVPLLLLSFASSAITFLAQQRGGALSAESSFSANAGNAVVSYAKYLVKTVWPSGLAAYYPFDPAPGWQIVLATAGIIAISFAAARPARRMPFLAAGWLWYLITFLPVIGFVRIGQHAMADRYTYVPLIGLFVMLAWGVGDVAERLRLNKKALAVTTMAVIMICSVLTNLQARKWHDSVTLFTYALKVTRNNALAHKNLAEALAQRGNLVEALDHATESLRIQPEPKEYVTQGWLYLQTGNCGKAAEAARNSLALLPGHDKARFILGIASLCLKDYASATAEYTALGDMGSPYTRQLQDALTAEGVMVPARQPVR